MYIHYVKSTKGSKKGSNAHQDFSRTFTLALPQAPIYDAYRIRCRLQMYTKGPQSLYPALSPPAQQYFTWLVKDQEVCPIHRNRVLANIESKCINNSLTPLSLHYMPSSKRERPIRLLPYFYTTVIINTCLYWGGGPISKVSFINIQDQDCSYNHG